MACGIGTQRELTPQEKSALQQLSWSYGAGDFLWAVVQTNFTGAYGVAVFEKQYGFKCVNFRISDGKMFAYGRRKKIENT